MVEVTHDPNFIILSGFTFDKVKETGGVLEKEYQHLRKLQGLTEYGGNRWEEIKKSNSMADEVAAGASFFSKVAYQGFKYSWNVAHSVNKVPPSRILAFHRTLFKTEAGYMGLSSKDIEEGDSITFFQGGKCRWSFVAVKIINSGLFVMLISMVSWTGMRLMLLDAKCRVSSELMAEMPFILTERLRNMVRMCMNLKGLKEE